MAAAALALCELIDDQTYTRFLDAVDAVAARSALRPRITDPMQQFIVDGGAFVARYYADPSDAALPALAEALVRSSADLHIDASLRCAAALAALMLFDDLLDVDRIRWAELTMRDLVADPALNPRLSDQWMLWLARAYHITEQRERAHLLRQQLLDSGREMVGETRLRLAVHDIKTLLAEGRIAETRQALQRAEPLPGPRSLTSAALWHATSSRLALQDRQLAAALMHAHMGIKLLREVECPPRLMGWMLMQEGQVEVARGQYAKALPFFEECGNAHKGVQADYCWCLAHFTRALDHAEGGSEALLVDELEAGFAIALKLDWVRFFGPNPRAATRLCGLALEREIEAEFVRRVIAERGLEAQQPELAEWPWPIRMRLLGRFEIEIDGQQLALRGKGARKPLELLHFIIASGGSDVATGGATCALWPELEGDKAKVAFNVTLHRLRKLLGRNEAIELEVGKLGIDLAHIWVDCLAFESLADQLKTPLTAAQVRLADRAQALYQGPWREDDDDAPWQMVYRSRLAGKFKRVVRALVAYRIEQGETAAARDLLERAIDLDPLAEDLSRELMQLLAARGETAAALAVFNRCQATLVALLGARPSAATLQLEARLRAGFSAR